MASMCASCGAPIQGNYRLCTMCSGNPFQGSDNYAQQYLEREAAERLERERQQQADWEQHQHDMGQ